MALHSLDCNSVRSHVSVDIGNIIEMITLILFHLRDGSVETSHAFYTPEPNFGLPLDWFIDWLPVDWFIDWLPLVIPITNGSNAITATYTQVIPKLYPSQMVAMPSQQLLLHQFLDFSSFFLRWIMRKSQRMYWPKSTWWQVPTHQVGRRRKTFIWKHVSARAREGGYRQFRELYRQFRELYRHFSELYRRFSELSSYQCLTNASPMPHQCLTNASQMPHKRSCTMCKYVFTQFGR